MAGRALLVLDVNRDVAHPRGRHAAAGFAAHSDGRAVPARVAAQVARARQAGDLVVWTVPGAEFLRELGIEPSEGWGLEVDDRFGVPLPAEPAVHKAGVGAFAGTGLEQLLRGAGVEEVALAGIATSYVVAATASEALAAGFRVAVLEDCCADASDEAHAAALAALPADVAVTRTAP